MPIRVWVEPERRLIRVEISGDSTTVDIIDAIDRVVDDPRSEPGYDILSDHLMVGEPLTTPQAREMAAHMQKLGDLLTGSRWAAVTRKTASIGMMRMMAVLLNRIPVELEVFQTIDDAEEWLFGRGEGTGSKRRHTTDGREAEDDGQEE